MSDGPEAIDPRLLKLVAAPFSRPLSILRVQSIADRYELLVKLDTEIDPKRIQAITMRLLFRHPSAHLEHGAHTDLELDRRLDLAHAELVNLRAAAPLPAPVDRTDRTFILALADVEWMMREFLHVRRSSRRMTPERLAARYLSSRRPDPLPDLDAALVHAVGMIPRGHLLRTSAQIAGARHGVMGLRGEIAKEAPKPLVPTGPGGKVRVCTASEIREGCAKTVEAFGRTVAVFRDHGALKAIDDMCPHRGGPLSQGDLENGAVICPLHAWTFDLTTGKMRGNPRVVVPTYEVVVEGDQVFVEKK